MSMISLPISIRRGLSHLSADRAPQSGAGHARRLWVVLRALCQLMKVALNLPFGHSEFIRGGASTTAGSLITLARQGWRVPCRGVRSAPFARALAWQRLQRQPLPSRYHPDDFACAGVVRDTGKPPAQFDRGRELALLLEDGADGGSISFGDGEHGWHMMAAVRVGKP